MVDLCATEDQQVYKGASTEVPALYASMAAQAHQAFYELIGHHDPSATVYIEAHDDVSVVTDKSIEFIQVKTASSPRNNPCSDLSGDLWKTLANWIGKLAGGLYDSYKKKFRYSVCSSGKRVGEVITAFSKATGEAESNEAYEFARRIVERSTPNRYRKSFFSEENRQFAIEVIKSFSYEVHEDFLSETETLFYELGSFPESWRQDLFLNMLGWMNEASAPFTKKSEPVKIARRDYQKQLIGRSERYRPSPLSASVPEPTEEEVSFQIRSYPNYLMQLEIIDLESEKMQAAKDFLRSRVQVERWSEKVLVTEIEITEYQERLYQDWHDIRGTRLCGDGGGISDNDNRKKRGCDIFFETRKHSRQVQIRSSMLPPYVGPGQLHDLADSLKIGWHPEYSSLIGGLQS